MTQFGFMNRSNSPLERKLATLKRIEIRAAARAAEEARRRALCEEVVARALRDMEQRKLEAARRKEAETNQVVRAQLIMEDTCKKHGITLEMMRSHKRMRYLSTPRQEAYYLIARDTDFTLPQISRFFGARDHTSVLHGIRMYALKHGLPLVRGKATREEVALLYAKKLERSKTINRRRYLKAKQELAALAEKAA